MFELLIYKDSGGRKPYADWLANLADRHAKARVLVRVSRMAAGNFGDCKPVAEGVWELRIDWGPGYRVYYAQVGKRKQQADIDAAVGYLNDWKKSNGK